LVPLVASAPLLVTLSAPVALATCETLMPEIAVIALLVTVTGPLVPLTWMPNPPVPVAVIALLVIVTAPVAFARPATRMPPMVVPAVLLAPAVIAPLLLIVTAPGPESTWMPMAFPVRSWPVLLIVEAPAIDPVPIAVSKMP
jgi:hypothetical protein